MEIIRILLNLFWLFLAGWVTALSYAFAGLIMIVLIVTIPFGIASFRLAAYALWPFGRTVIRDPDAGAASVIGNVLWFILAGWWLALSQVLLGIGYCITIVGIPLGIACFKLAGLSVNPLGKRIVDSDYANAARTGWSGYVPVQ